MTARLKPIADQVVVLTGASSGIGLATARLLAAQGARLVLVARNASALEEIAEEIEDNGGHAIAVPADVARREDLEHVAERAIAAYGGFDTWINNAGVSVYGTLEEIPLADQRRLFDVNYWGIVQGSLIAARHLRQRGGAIINTGSVLSDWSVVLQGPYSASKHAVKGFTDTFRMELEHDGAPISVTLIKPSGIDTPLFEHARSYLDSRGVRNPPPAYDPHLVAQAMLYACQNPKRDLVIGMGGFALPLMGAHFPRTTDRLLESTMVEYQKGDTPAPQGWRDNLYAPRTDGEEYSKLPGPPPRRTSLFLAAQMNPKTTAAIMAGLGLGLAALVGRGAVGRAMGRTGPRGPAEKDGRLELPMGEW
jgi:NAD(P)-dependent dehydrogenase (short-subunit alcohol dehydrogenase family)